MSNNLSEEEKKAIDNLKFNITNNGFSLYGGTTNIFKLRDIEIVLNLIDRLQKESENKRNKKYKDKKEANRVWWNAHKDERNEKRRLQRKENKEQINAEIRKKRAEDIDYRDKRRYYTFKFNHKNDNKRNYTFEEWKQYKENKEKKKFKEIPLLEDF